MGRRRALPLVAVLALLGAGWRPGDGPPAPNSPDEPKAEKLSLARAGAFLDAVALDWTRTRKCGTCHTNYNYLFTRPALGGESPALAEVRAFFERRVEHWDDAESDAHPRWPAEVVATASSLALNDAQSGGNLHPMTKRALDRMWTIQRPDGAWDWLKCAWPPYEHDDDYGATFAAVGLAAAPVDYRETDAARKGLEKLRAYFRDHPGPSLHHRAMRLWASAKLDGVLTDERKQAVLAELLAAQRPDGGWNLASLGDWKRRDGSANDAAGPGDGFGTGFVVYVLRQAGLPADHPAIAKGVAWLKANQRASGRWFTRSVTNDKAHYITHAGTGFAILALRSCGVADAD